MIKNSIYKLIREPKLIDNKLLNKIENTIKEYPYFHLTRILYLKYLYSTDIEKFKNELAIATVYIPNMKQLFRYFNDDKSLFIETEYSELEENKDRLTEKKSKKLKVREILEYPSDKIIHTSVYNLENETRELEKTYKVEAKVNQLLIDEFIMNSPHICRNNNKEMNTPILNERAELEEVYMTETLAAIYVKQKLYHKAILVYEKLSLKNPQKSVYFVTKVKEIKRIINDKL
jgi:hypothetical protein